jgi:hypothetical protein
MELPLNMDRATLFFDAATSKAVLIRSVRGQQQERVRRFTDALAACQWCIKTRTHFVLFWPSAAQQN